MTGAPDDLGFLHCAGCGARLRKAPSIKVTVQSPTPSSAAPVTAASTSTMPPRGSSEKLGDADAILARLDAHEASATLPPGSVAALKKDIAPAPAAPAGANQIAEILLAIQKDIKDLRKSHSDLATAVDKLREAPKTPPPTAVALKTASTTAKTPAQLTALVVDDDENGRTSVQKALSVLGFTSTVVDAGEAAMAAMAKERPAVIVIEGAMAGALSGKDFVNYVKSTMEWIDIPILLHTREKIANHEVARTEYGADDFVAKEAGSAGTVARKALRLLS